MPPRIGLYGISGSGKTYLLDRLNSLDAHLVEGSKVIFDLDPCFSQKTEQEKTLVRENAIRHLIDTFKDRSTVVSGHYSFPTKDGFESVMTHQDHLYYTHIVYLDIPATTLYDQRSCDTRYRQNKLASPEYLQAWIDHEKQGLSEACSANGIKLVMVTDTEQAERVLIDWIQEYKENNSRAIQELNNHAINLESSTEVWVVDGDKTLSHDDTGRVFWDSEMSTKIKNIFSEGYLYGRFAKVSHCYSTIPTAEYLERCTNVARQTVLRQSLVYEITKAHARGVVVILVSSGIKECWELILQYNGLGFVKVVAGNRDHGFVVDPTTKESLVDFLKMYGRVVAFGDSPVDYLMLEKAHLGILIDFGQNLVDAPEKVTRMNLTGNLDNELNRFLELEPQTFFHDYTEEPISKILATRTRSGDISGYALRKAHEDVGVYMAYKLANRIGCESVNVKHVQGGTTPGHCLKNEAKIAIVPLLRGGEPMALGISSVFQNAMILHAKSPKDIQDSDLQACDTIILVDSVLNTGKSIREFINDIAKRSPQKGIKVYVVIGVTQEGAIQGLRKSFEYGLGGIGQVEFHTLRVSKNKYTGRGGTDTGHRLFLTYHRDQ